MRKVILGLGLALVLSLSIPLQNAIALPTNPIKHETVKTFEGKYGKHFKVDKNGIDELRYFHHPKGYVAILHLRSGAVYAEVLLATPEAPDIQPKDFPQWQFIESTEPVELNIEPTEDGAVGIAKFENGAVAILRAVRLEDDTQQLRMVVFVYPPMVHVNW